MTASQHRVSLGALALLLCLALPSGLLSLFAESTTGEQVDGADLIVAGRVASLQDIAEPESTAVEFAVNEVLWGRAQLRSVNVTISGKAPLQVGDTVVALLSHRPAELLGVLQLRKHPRTLEWNIVSPVTGMLAQGLGEGGTANPVPVKLFQEAVALRKGTLPRGGGSQPAEGAEGSIDPDAYEPNDTLATATNVTGLYPPSLVTGNPTLITGLTLTPNDVDWFSFEAGALDILHAETLALTGLQAPDTLIGLFTSPAGDLLAHDDDGGQDTLSQLTVPLEHTGTYAVAVESAPDTNLDFAGDEGTTVGHYNLALQLELGSYIWNQLDLILGVSPDGTFIEDFIGFKEIGASDFLIVGVPADGWAVAYDISNAPTAVTHVYGGAGEQLTDPGFVNPLLPLSFQLSSFEDAAGLNRRGQADASSAVTFTLPGEPPRGVVADFHYEMSVGATTVAGVVDLQAGTHGQVDNLLFTRVTDIDLFGEGIDQFYWSFNPASPLQAFAVDSATNVGNVVAPAQPFSNATGDLQAAVLVNAGSLTAAQSFPVNTAFAFTQGHASAILALNDCVRDLRDAGVDTWVVAVDKDPVTGLYAALGTGVGN